MEEKTEIENFRGMQRAWVIDVCEGEGTPKSPSCIVHYVFDDCGHPIGVVDPRKG